MHMYAYTAYIVCTNALEYRINDLASGSLYKSAVLTRLSFCVCICRRVKFRRRLLNHSCIFAHSLSSNSSHTFFFVSFGMSQDLACTLLSSVELCAGFCALQGPPKVVAYRNEYWAKEWCSNHDVLFTLPIPTAPTFLLYPSFLPTPLSKYTLYPLILFNTHIPANPSHMVRPITQEIITWKKTHFSAN